MSSQIEEILNRRGSFPGSTLKDGETCTLIDALQTNLPAGVASQLGSNGVVRVSTTSTSVTFTVKEPGYFASTGSTISFRFVERGGNLLLQQSGQANHANVIARIGIAAGAGKETWSYMARKLRRFL